MKQKQYAPLSVAEMSISMYAVDRGYFDKVPVNKVSTVEAELHAYCHANHPDLMAKIDATGNYNDEIDKKIKAAIEACMQTLTW